MKKLTRKFFPFTVLLLSSFLLPLGIHCADASSSSKVTFKWKANPPQEFVAGYRLYYGTQSRLKSNGAPKNNFSYTYCIDFTEQVRCQGPDFTSCKQLSAAELQCENLFSENPKCTVANLNGELYFAMTAYTNSAESSYTYELKSKFDALPKQADHDALVAIRMLLLKD